ncbi:hypothetical protein KSI01_19030 [Kurthia sibirica]|nr:hypothetical protein KSI01_19030 [Kurthia sibirica]
MELLTAVLFVIAYLCFDFSTELLIAWLFISLFTIIVVSDICYMIIQDKILVAFGIPLTFLRVLTPLEPWWDMLVGGLFGFGLFLLIAIMSKGGMGGGDIKLYLIIGLVLGFKLTFISIILAAFIGLFVAIVTRTKKGQPLPFAPSIAVGSLLSYFYGSELFNLYLRLLL